MAVSKAEWMKGEKVAKVTISKSDIRRAKHLWPALYTSLPDSDIWFKFDSRAELIDIGPKNVIQQGRLAAISYLVDEARTFVRRELGIPRPMGWDVNPRDYTAERARYMSPDHKMIARGPNDAIVYGSTHEHGRHAGKPSAIAFQGKRGKPDWHYIFRSAENRDTHIAKWMDDINRRMGTMAQRKVSRTIPVGERRLVPGMVLYSLWGYDQTNIDFYRIAKRTKAFVWLAPMGKHDVGDSHMIPYMVLPGKKLLRRKVQVWDGKEHGVSITSYSSAFPWEGRPMYETPYGMGHNPFDVATIAGGLATGLGFGSGIMAAQYGIKKLSKKNPRKLKYDKASLDSAIKTALKLHSKNTPPFYIFATAYGYKIDLKKPPFGQSYIQVNNDGTIIKHIKEFTNPHIGGSGDEELRIRTSRKLASL